MASLKIYIQNEKFKTPNIMRLTKLKLTYLAVLAGTCLHAQKPVGFAIKYNFAPNLYGVKSFGLATEFPLVKSLSVELSHAKGNFDKFTTATWQYSTTMAELRYK
jgi:hypothetical protein